MGPMASSSNWYVASMVSWNKYDPNSQRNSPWLSLASRTSRLDCSSCSWVVLPKPRGAPKSSKPDSRCDGSTVSVPIGVFQLISASTPQYLLSVLGNPAIGSMYRPDRKLY